MAFWPADSREDVPVHSNPLKKKVKQTRWEYPYVTEGSITATTLVNKDGKFEWTHVLQNKGQFVLIVDEFSNNSFFPRVKDTPEREEHSDLPCYEEPRSVDMEKVTREISGSKCEEWE